MLGIGWADLVALATVVAIDVTMAGDNALVVGMAAAGLPRGMRRRAILLGITGAAALRILFAVFTVRLLAIVGLMAAGGLLLLWVAWKLLREIRAAGEEQAGEAALAQGNGASGGERMPTKTMRQAVTQILVADLSMSLDNVLAVAGAAREHFWVLVLGLALSVGLMGVAAGLVARVIHRHRWIAYVGLAIILYVALSMIWDGGRTVIGAAGVGNMGLLR